MRWLVGTRQTQGQRVNDFCYVEEGEPMRPGSQCRGGSVDDDCGCRRALFGVATHKGSTTVRVADVEYSAADLVQAMSMTRTTAGEDYERLARVAERYPVGTVLEVRDGEFHERVPIALTVRAVGSA